MSAAELERDTRAEQVRDTAVRSFRRQQRQRYAHGFVESMIDVDVMTEGGIWIGRQPAIPLTPEVGQVVARIARGLFFREFGRPLPPTHEVMKPHLDQQGRSLQILCRTIGGPIGLAREPVVACGGEFRYFFAMVHDAQDTGVWAGQFFGQVWAMAFLQQRGES